MLSKVTPSLDSRRKSGVSDVRAVQRTASLLEAMSLSGAGASLSSLAFASGLSQATALRYLLTLVGTGLVEKDADGSYRLGLGFLLLWERAVGDLDPRKVAAPAMEQLREEYGETVNLAAFRRGRVILIDAREGHQPIRMGAMIGQEDPVHSAGVGKAILAHLGAAERRALLLERGLPRLTDATITELEALERELTLVRERGYAIDDEESTVGLRCVAIPLFDHHGAPAFGLSVSAPAATVTREAAHEIGVRMVPLTESISRRFGYSGSTPPTP